MPEPIVQNPGIQTGIEKKQSLTLVAAIILFILSLAFGIFSGLSLGKDKANYENVSNIYRALNYFFKDQDRFPTADEFSSQKILAPFYMSTIPMAANLQGACKNFTDYVYARQTTTSYDLQFCLNNAVSGWNSGLNTLSVSK